MHAVDNVLVSSNLLYASAMIFSIGANVVKNKEVVDGTCRKDSVT